MSKDEVLVGLDIGSTHVRVAVGQRVYSEDQKNPALHIVGVVEVPSEGVNRGVVTNIDDAVKSISKAIDQAEKMTGLPIQSAWIALNGEHITAQVSRGIVAVSKTDGEITIDDVERAIEATKTITTPPNHDILHVLPRHFMVDGQEGIKDPVGMSGMRLEIDAYIVHGRASEINNLTKSVYLAALDIDDLVLSSLACAEAALTSKQKELGVAVVNIGAASTTLAVFEEGTLLHVATIPIGSERITKDLAIGLRTSPDVAEQIKIQYGKATSKDIENASELELSQFDESEDGSVKMKYVAEIIEARVEQLFEKIDEELKKIERNGALAAGVVLCGGGSKLSRITDVAKVTLRMSATLGYPTNVSSVIDGVRDLGMTCAVGLVKWGNNAMESHSKYGSKFKSVSAVTGQVRKWFKTLMP